MADKDTRTQARGHEATWGATEAAKAAWADRNAEPVRKSIEKDNKAKEVDGV